MILVTGATGNVGRQLVRQLVEAGQPVRALTRQPERANLPDGVQVVGGDLTEPESLPAALDAVEQVYLFPIPDAVHGFVEVVRTCGVRRIVVLSSLAAGSGNPVGSGHLIVERAIEAAGVEWTHLRPGAFAANALWQWGPSIRAEGVVRAPYGDAALAPIHEADIAAVAAAALLQEGHTGHRYELSGPESLTYREQVAILTQVIGRDVSFIEMSPRQARQQMISSIPEPIVDGLLALLADAVGKPATVLSTVEQVTGRSARTFAQWAAEHAADFRAG